jgi:predicted nucleic acid-binding protein
MRLFLDANVLFSAAHGSGGRARALFLLARTGRCELYSSPHAIEEARRNIEIKYPEKYGDFDSLVSEVRVTAEAAPKNIAWAVEQSLPLEDAPILTAAVEAKTDLLVTGDRTHFGHLYCKSLRKVHVVSLAEALGQIMF